MHAGGTGKRHLDRLPLRVAACVMANANGSALADTGYQCVTVERETFQHTVWRRHCDHFGERQAGLA